MSLSNQSVEPLERRTNYVRRALGLAICLGPVVLAAVSFAVGLVRIEFGLWGLGVAVGGFLFGILNAYLTVVRPWRYRRRHGSMEGFRFQSPLPLVGTVCVVIANIIGFGELLTAALGLATLALDTGGLPWFVAMTWRDRGFWDGEPFAAQQIGPAE